MAYTKTEWVNGETPINESNLNNIENGIEALQPNIITAIVGENITFSSTTTINDLSLVEHSKVGSAFTLENGKITVGSEVNNVRLSGQIRVTNRSSANGVYNIYIYKNDEIVTAGRTAIVGSGSTVGASASSFVTEVAEGDVLKFGKHQIIHVKFQVLTIVHF